VLDPRGPVGQAERVILYDTTAIMLAVVVPVIILTLAFAWWFRASNRRATTVGGPSGAELFDKEHVFLETLCLLASSVTCGFGSIAIHRTDARAMYFWMGITFLLGVCFLTLEGREFASMVERTAAALLWVSPGFVA
jgi:heme/copper-type cytochrome/quinol oxidase subunit 3